jgi:hypothetical protein
MVCDSQFVSRTNWNGSRVILCIPSQIHNRHISTHQAWSLLKFVILISVFHHLFITACQEHYQFQGSSSKTFTQSSIQVPVFDSSSLSQAAFSFSRFFAPLRLVHVCCQLLFTSSKHEKFILRCTRSVIYSASKFVTALRRTCD